MRPKPLMTLLTADTHDHHINIFTIFCLLQIRRPQCKLYTFATANQP